MANERDLEDFASGIGPGAYSPQQGSGLPVAAQGGLPLGASPSVPPRAVPPPSFQRAPLMQLGGQAPDLNAMIAERLQAIQGFNPMAKNTPQAEDAYAYAMHALPKLQGLASVKSQDRQLQAQYLKESASQLEKFHAMPPEQQAALRPFMSGYLKNTSKLAGMDLDDESVTHALTSPNLAGTYASIINDPLVNPQAQQAYLSRIGAAKPGKERDDASALVSKEIEQHALSTIQSALPQVVAQMGGSAQKPLDMQTFLTSPQIKQILDQSPILKRTFNAYVSNKANEDFLASVGLKPGSVSVKSMEQRAKGPESTGEVKDVLASIMGPDGTPLTPASAGALAPGATITLKGGKVVPLPRGGADVFDLAKQQVFENKLDISERQGFRTVLAKAGAERQVPLVQVDGMKDVHVINKDTEQPVDRIVTTLDMLQKGGGETKFAVMNGKSYEAFQAAKESDAVLGQYLDIARSLTTTPGANWPQALTFYAKTKMGVDNPGVAFDALNGTLLRMARAMQGSSSQLSNLDVRSISGMLPSTTDSMPTALRRLEISARIVQNMKDVQMGKMPPSKLLDQIEAAKKDVARMGGVDIYKDEKGQSIAIPRGQSHPGKGWTKQ